MAKPSPTTTTVEPETPAEANELVGTFKRGFNVKLDLNTFAGLLDPQIDKLVDSAVEAADKAVKKDSTFRLQVFNYGLGMLSGKVESAAEHVGEPMKTTLRKFSDFLDGFREKFYGSDKKKKTSTTGLDDALVKAIVKIDEAFLKRCDDVLGSTDAFDPGAMEAVLKQLEAEATARDKLKRIVLEGPKESPGPEKPKVPLTKRLDETARYLDKAAEKTLGPVNHELEQQVARWKAANQALERKVAARGPQRRSLIGMAWHWLSKP